MEMMKERKLAIATRVSELTYITVNCKHGTFLVTGNTENPRHPLDAFSGYISKGLENGTGLGGSVAKIRVTKVRDTRLDGAASLFMCVYDRDGVVGLKVYTEPIFVKFGPNVDSSQFQV